MKVSPTIFSRYLSTSRTSSGSFHVPRASLSIRGSGRRGLHLRLPPNPLCTGPSRFPLQVVGPLGNDLASLVRAWPGRVPQGANQPAGALQRVPTPGLAPGWDPGSAVPGDLTCLDCVVLMRVSWCPLFVLKKNMSHSMILPPLCFTVGMVCEAFIPPQSVLHAGQMV
ncbi:hypothetical protein ATANTOWER_029005 [Ataeniobius toweri]|uniref:Uncharacterized protein n=1 Tax=Ataeniobius toweri TaxID=208326 RepID=A0ABU7A965_9TELE|nr:hypothetical protein [Ataeniobius toweri]